MRIEDLERRINNLENDMMLVRDRSLSPIEVKVGSFTCPAATGYKAVTGVGFKPRYVEFMISRQLTADIRFGRGWMDYNGNQASIAIASRDDDQISDIVGINVQAIRLLTQAGVGLVTALYVSMDNDGFTINFTAADALYTIIWKAVR